MSVRVLTVVAVVVMLAGCAPVAPPPRQVQNPCIRHAPLDYSPILVKVVLTANYNLKDADGFHSYTPAVLFRELQATNPGKYQLADGVIPNLILNVTVTNDGHNHYGAILMGSGNGEGHLFRYTWGQNYVTGRKLFSDIASMVNAFITKGWNNGRCG